MKLLTIEMPVKDAVFAEYMDLPIEQRAGYIQEMFRIGRLKLEDFTTEMEGEFPDVD